MASAKKDSGKLRYGMYQFEIYTDFVATGKRPILTTDPNKLEEAAKKAMAPEAFNYVFGGAGEQSTVIANRQALRQWTLIPRMLRPTSPRDLSVTLFGKRYETPILMAPIGVQAVYHPDAETGTSTACASLGVPFIYSTAASTPLETVIKSADAAVPDHLTPKDTPPSAPRWFQLYRPHSNDLTTSLLQRALKANCDALVVTLDTFTMAWRPLDLDSGYLPFATGEGNALGFTDPVFRAQFKRDSGGEEVEENRIPASRLWAQEVFSGQAHRWEDLGMLRRVWGEKKPIVLKGVLSVEDARLAVEWGVDGIIVSNHGGRQLDGAVPALEVLPEIVDAVGDKITVLYDSGIRTGADAIKALALGAKAVLVGRPIIYGLGIAGGPGARHVLAGILADLDQSMGLAGVKSVAELNRGMLRRISYGDAGIKSLL